MKNPVCQRSAGYNRNVPKVTFLPEGKTVEFESGKLPYDEHGKPESILDVAINFGIHIEHACGGSCACTTCHVIVKHGDENLNRIPRMTTNSTGWITRLRPDAALAARHARQSSRAM